MFGKAAFVLMSWCDTNAMMQHLVEISAMSNALVVPVNITNKSLPPNSPELNPVEKFLALHA